MLRNVSTMHNYAATIFFLICLVLREVVVRGMFAGYPCKLSQPKSSSHVVQLCCIALRLYD